MQQKPLPRPSGKEGMTEPQPLHPFPDLSALSQEKLKKSHLKALLFQSLFGFEKILENSKIFMKLIQSKPQITFSHFQHWFLGDIWYGKYG